MNKFTHDLKIRLVKLLHLALIVASFAAGWYLFYADNLLHPFYRRGNWAIIALFAVFYIFLARTYEAYMISTNRIPETLYSLVLSLLLADGAMLVVIWLINKLFPDVLPLLLIFGVQSLVSLIWSLLSHWWYFRTHRANPSIVIYDQKDDLEQLIYEYGYDKKFSVEKLLSVEECLSDLEQLTEVETVFITDVRSHNRNIILKFCVQHGITVYVIPRIGDVIMSGARSMHMFHLPMLRVGRYRPSPEYMILKRTFDIVMSLIGLIVASPLMAVIALCIKLNDGGPVLYKQERLTKDGRIFKLVKFRSMRPDAEKDGIARLSAGEDDDRVTPIGRVIRKTRMDELPQLLNILKGDMTFVGPRPERPEIARQYEELIPEFSLRLQTKAGLTGYAQVYGKYNTTPYNKLELDLLYIAKPSILEDLRIMLATVKILFVPESTQGIDVSGVTALDKEETAVNK